MKNYENCPVNEWNSDATRLGYETAWPWDVVVPKSIKTAADNSVVEKSAVARVGNETSEAARRAPQHLSAVGSIATV